MLVIRLTSEICRILVYKYLGIYFSEFLTFEENAEILSESAGRALGAIVSKLKRNNFMGYSTYTKLYDMCVAPIIDYSSEIWGYKNYCQTNVVQNRAMRIFLGVHRFAPVAGLEGDMAWLSPQLRRWLKMLCYWNRLVKMDNNRCTKAVFIWAYECSQNGMTNWCSDISAILTEIGIPDSFQNRDELDIDFCKAKLVEKQKMKWSNAVQLKPKLRFYTLFKTCFCTDEYLMLNLSSSERSVLAQIRFGILPLHVETGRFVNKKLEERRCEICHSDVIEEECHFLSDFIHCLRHVFVLTNT